MNLEGIVLSEISQTEKDKYCMVSIITLGGEGNRERLVKMHKISVIR